MHESEVPKVAMGHGTHVHYIGIGGIGISALARMMLARGARVTGSDRSPSLITDELEKAGATVAIGHSAANISRGIDMVVYTHALSPDNPELIAAKEAGIPVFSYPEMLGMVSEGKYTIAVAGTHGKTTTTAMVGHILRTAGFDPTIVVGSLMKEFPPTNFIAGTSNYFVVEADEYKRSFLQLSPKVLVITNLDLDHLDYYTGLADIQSAFRALAEKVPADGFLVTNAAHQNSAPVVDGCACSVVDYAAIDLGETKLSVPGEHNRENARAAIAAAALLGVPLDDARNALASFPGTWRRFELKGTMPGGASVYDDYAHNPQKIRAALSGAREVCNDSPSKRVVAVFQPHLYSRTKTLFDAFTQSFDDADEVILLPIYAARETYDSSISSRQLAAALGPKARAADSFDEARSMLNEYDTPHTLVLVIGAGDVTSLAASLVHDQQ